MMPWRAHFGGSPAKMAQCQRPRQVSRDNRGDVPIQNEKDFEAAFSSEIHDVNNGECDHHRAYAEAEYKPDVVPRHTLSGLPRRYYGALLWTLGRTHDVLLL